MKRRNWLLSAVGALALGFLVVPAQAAPVSGMAGDLKTATDVTSGVHQVHRRHYRHRHYRKHRQLRNYRHYRHYRHYRRSPGIQLYIGPRQNNRYYGRHWN